MVVVFSYLGYRGGKLRCLVLLGCEPGMDYVCCSLRGPLPTGFAFTSIEWQLGAQKEEKCGATEKGKCLICGKERNKESESEGKTGDSRFITFFPHRWFVGFYLSPPFFLSTLYGCTAYYCMGVR